MSFADDSPRFGSWLRTLTKHRERTFGHLNGRGSRVGWNMGPPNFREKAWQKYSDLGKLSFFPIHLFFWCFLDGIRGWGWPFTTLDGAMSGKGDNCIIAYGIWLTDPDGQGGDDAVACLQLGSDWNRSWCQMAVVYIHPGNLTVRP